MNPATIPDFVAASTLRGESTAAANSERPEAQNAPLMDETPTAGALERRIALVTYAGKTSTNPGKVGNAPWPKLAPHFTKHDIRDQKDGVGYSPLRLKPGGTRNNASVEAISALVADSDSGTSFEEVCLRLQGLAAAVHTTHSHAPEHECIRAILPLSEDVLAQDWAAFRAGAVERFGADIFDRNTKDASRFYYFPSCPTAAAEHRRGTILEGRLLDPAPLIARGRELLARDVYVVTQGNETSSFSGVDASDLISSAQANPLDPYLCTENREDFRAALHAAIPNPQTRDEWRVGELALAYLVVAHNWPEDEAKALLDEWSARAEGADTTNNDRDWQDALKRTHSRAAAGERSVITHLSILKPARAAGWTPRATVPAMTCPAGAEPWLVELNGRYAWITEVASVYRLEFGNFIKPADFRLQEDCHQISVPNGNGSKAMGRGSAWLRHPGRREHKRLVLRPGEAVITSDGYLNQWRGFSIRPKQGDVQPFMALLSRLCPDRAARHYILQWLAHLVQRPATKMHVSIVLWSHQQGVGKNLLLECLVGIIGSSHATVITQGDLTADFNSWANQRVFVIGDEVANSDRRKEADKLKGLITGTTIRLNEKYQPAREAANLINFAFLSNHADALFLDDHDRRFFVWEVTATRLPQAEAERFVRWRDGEGLAALLHFLLRYDLGGFDPKAPAPMTAAKAEMIEDSRSALERWVADLMQSDVSRVLGREVATANDLGRRYVFDTGRREQPSDKAITGVCKRLGALARQVRLRTGAKRRALALAHTAAWANCPESEWGDELAKPLRLN